MQGKMKLKKVKISNITVKKIRLRIDVPRASAGKFISLYSGDKIVWVQRNLT